MVVERFAPSPTGLLHLGHAYSAVMAWRAAKTAGGRLLVRLEDLDRSRVRPAYEAAIAEDLAWLGLDWDGPMLRQSDRGDAYAAALAQLAAKGLTYRCTCTRRDIADAISAPQEGAMAATGPDGPVYPGTCRGRNRAADEPFAIRLNMAAALEHLSAATLSFHELSATASGMPEDVALDLDQVVGGTGDVVLARRDGAVAYHLAVVIDDAFQGVTHVTRGRDLFSATPIHRVLQALLDLPAPTYRHHKLVRDEYGKRLAKRDDARAIASYRKAGLSPADVIALAEGSVG
ncbi:MAG: tRNA glutamyl-Q(34) synthetase GluQRS [Pseudomonadota bacterium]